MSKVDDFFQWMEEFYPDIRLLPWQEAFVKMYLIVDVKQLILKPRASGRKFISELVKEFNEYKEHEMIIGDNLQERCPRCGGKVSVRVQLIDKTPARYGKGLHVYIYIQCWSCEWERRKYISLKKMLIDTEYKREPRHEND